MSRTSVRARAVSSRTCTTVATRHSSRGGAVGSSVVTSGVALIALLAPWIAPVMVAKLLPESARVVLHKLEPTHPLRALPEVQVRHEQPRRTAMFRGQWRTVVSERHPRLATG